MDRERELEARLERYQVTTVAIAPRLHLVWSAPDESEVTDVDGTEDAEPEGVALLAAYRITRVPSRTAV